jgi:DNA invertase Pin-like site-specific DNA recombinase
MTRWRRARRDSVVDDVRKPAPVWLRPPDIGRSPSKLVPGKRVIGYVTLSADAPREDADAPTQVIGEACERAGWNLVDLVTDRDHGRGLVRPGLTFALQQIAEGKADGLVVSAVLVALDLGIDSSSPVGQALAEKLITLGEWEHERISRRTRNALEEARAGGATAGRPAVADRPELAERINAMRASGMTLQAIADRLNAEGVATMRGGTMWRPSSVQAALGYRRPGSRSPRDQLPSLGDDRQG